MTGRIRRATFADLRRARGARAGAISIRWVPLPEGTLQVAYTVPKAAGGAVVRNRLRRRLRAITREVAGQMAPGAYLVSAGPAAARAPLEDLRSDTIDALAALAQRR